MAQSTMLAYKGARTVTFEELASVPTPPPARRWYPISHKAVVDRVQATLFDAGFSVSQIVLALSRGDQRFFGTIDLRSELGHGTTLSVGIRSSIDQSLPLGFCAGTRVFVCSNLAFSADLIVKRKHTLHAPERFQADIAEAVAKLGGFQRAEERRIARMAETPVPEERAESLILRAYEKGIVPVTLLSRVLREYREPTYEEFRPRTLWSLQNAITTVIGERAKADPNKHAVMTMRLAALLAPPSLN